MLCFFSSLPLYLLHIDVNIIIFVILISNNHTLPVTTWHSLTEKQRNRHEEHTGMKVSGLVMAFDFLGCAK